MITKEQRNIIIGNSSFLLILVLCIGIACLGAMSLWTIFRADDRHPMEIRNIKVVSQKLVHGDQFVYEFDYNKRIECYPPKGTGEVTYRVWLQDQIGNTYSKFLWVDPSTISYTDPAKHHRQTAVDLPFLRPGQYLMQYRARFVCEGASKVLEFDGPLMPFEVVN